MQEMLWEVHGGLAGVGLPPSHRSPQASLTPAPGALGKPGTGTGDTGTAPQLFSAGSVLQRSTAHNAAAGLSGK